MAIIASNKNTSPRELPDADVHHAICVFVEDVGFQKNKFEPTKPAQHKVIVFWELATKMDDGRPFMLSKRYTLSLHEKATLRHDLEAWRGKAFEPEELEGFDVENLIGKQCRLVVVHKEKTAGKRAEVSTIMKADPNGPKLTKFAAEPPKWVEEERSRAEGSF